MRARHGEQATKPPPRPPAKVRKWISEEARRRRCSESTVVARLSEMGRAYEWWTDGRDEI